jgi:hypothetical protein
VSLTNDNVDLPTTGLRWVGFRVRPSLFRAIHRRARANGRDMADEILEILESATRRPPTRRRVGHLRLLGADGTGTDAS